MKNGKFATLAISLLGVTLLPTVVMAMGAQPTAADEEAANARIQPMARIKLGAPQTEGAAAGNRSGEEIYTAVCGACHETGVADSPKTGDKAAWAPRIALGLEGLTSSAKAGKNAMPPNGGSDATTEELARAIIFMANKSGANFK